MPGRDGVRRLLVGPPGWGKTLAARATCRLWPGALLCADPIGDLWPEGETPPRDLTLLPRKATSADILRAMAGAAEGTLVVVDETPRFLPVWAGVDEEHFHPLLSGLDVARNAGLSFLLIAKRFTSLPPLVADLLDGIAWGRVWTPRSKSWLRDAGLDDDLNPASGQWAVAAPGYPGAIIGADALPAWLVGSPRAYRENRPAPLVLPISEIPIIPA